METDNKYTDIAALSRELLKAEHNSQKAAEALHSNQGCTRAKAATLSARWTAAAEARDRVAHKLHVAVVRAGLAARFPEDYYGEFPSGHSGYKIMIVRERP